MEDSFACLSEIDFEDEFLDGAVESIVSFSSGISSVSSYSAIDLFNNLDIKRGFKMPNRINTKSKINIPDYILIKIINFVRHFSE